VQQLTTQTDDSAIDELIGAGLADTEHDVTTINADATLQLLATIPAVDQAQSALPTVVTPTASAGPTSIGTGATPATTSSAEISSTSASSRERTTAWS
jgi:hypothetical protein